MAVERSFEDTPPSPLFSWDEQSSHFLKEMVPYMYLYQCLQTDLQKAPPPLFHHGEDYRQG
jgi:hypothetical protein